MNASCSGRTREVPRPCESHRYKPTTSDETAMPKDSESCCAVLKIVLAWLASRSETSAKTSEFMLVNWRDEKKPLREAEREDRGDRGAGPDRGERRHGQPEEERVPDEHAPVAEVAEHPRAH